VEHIDPAARVIVLQEHKTKEKSKAPRRIRLNHVVCKLILWMKRHESDPTPAQTEWARSKVSERLARRSSGARPLKPLTAQQERALELYKELGNLTAVAREMGISRECARNHYQRAVAKYRLPPRILTERQEMVARLVEECGGNQSEAARRLGVQPSSVCWMYASFDNLFAVPNAVLNRVSFQPSSDSE
jgi:DNA-binding NarL/FixJ family response regulator